ncbi:MAG: hypothetical protein HY818_04125 [Acetobacterium woodii]|nr:hypothetical protein [Acetobacterium woodii]
MQKNEDISKLNNMSKLIKIFRIAFDLTQDDFVAFMSISKTTLSEVESKGIITQNFLYKLYGMISEMKLHGNFEEELQICIIDLLYKEIRTLLNLDLNSNPLESFKKRLNTSKKDVIKPVKIKEDRSKLGSECFSGDSSQNQKLAN